MDTHDADDAKVSHEHSQHVVYFNGSPTGHCLDSVESCAPINDGLIGRTDTANSDGREWGWGVRVRECERVVRVFAGVSVCACAMCLQYTIMIFYPG